MALVCPGFIVKAGFSWELLLRHLDPGFSTPALRFSHVRASHVRVSSTCYRKGTLEQHRDCTGNNGGPLQGQGP